jgi:hypothetical protein
MRLAVGMEVRASLVEMPGVAQAATVVHWADQEAATEVEEEAAASPQGDE